MNLIKYLEVNSGFDSIALAMKLGIFNEVTEHCEYDFLYTVQKEGLKDLVSFRNRKCFTLYELAQHIVLTFAVLHCQV